MMLVSHLEPRFERHRQWILNLWFDWQVNIHSCNHNHRPLSFSSSLPTSAWESIDLAESCEVGDVTSMSPTQFVLLPDIVLLEVFSYLSCEDVLYAFGNLNNARLFDLLEEHGAFRQICLSSQLSRFKYHVLSQGIWRYHLVRSLVCKEMFSDFIAHLTPCPIFPSLTELRILSLRYASIHMKPFILAHSSTLTFLLLRRSDQCCSVTHIQVLLHIVLPHLHRLELLDTDVRSLTSV